MLDTGLNSDIEIISDDEMRANCSDNDDDAKRGNLATWAAANPLSSPESRSLRQYNTPQHQQRILEERAVGECRKGNSQHLRQLLMQTQRYRNEEALVCWPVSRFGIWEMRLLMATVEGSRARLWGSGNSLPSPSFAPLLASVSFFPPCTTPHLFTHTHTCIYMHIYMHVYTCTNIHTHIWQEHIYTRETNMNTQLARHSINFVFSCSHYLLTPAPNFQTYRHVKATQSMYQQKSVQVLWILATPDYRGHHQRANLQSIILLLQLLLLLLLR